MRWVWKSLEEGFSVGLYGWGVQLLVGFSYNYSFCRQIDWWTLSLQPQRRGRRRVVQQLFSFNFLQGFWSHSCLKDTYSFLIYLDLFLCDDKLNKNCGFEIIYLGIFSSFEMSIYLFFYQTKKFSTKKLKFDK